MRDKVETGIAVIAKLLKYSIVTDNYEAIDNVLSDDSLIHYNLVAFETISLFSLNDEFRTRFNNLFYKFVSDKRTNLDDNRYSREWGLINKTISRVNDVSKEKFSLSDFFYDEMRDMGFRMNKKNIKVFFNNYVGILAADMLMYVGNYGDEGFSYKKGIYEKILLGAPSLYKDFCENISDINLLSSYNLESIDKVYKRIK